MCPECKGRVGLLPDTSEDLTLKFECLECKHTWEEVCEDEYDYLGRVIEIHPIGMPGAGRFGGGKR